MDTERETMITIFAEEKRLFISRDRGMALTKTLAGTQLPVPAGGAHADEVNALIGNGTLAVTEDEIDWNGYIFVRVTSGWEVPWA